MRERKVGAATLRLMQGDITKVPADAVMNAANEALIPGGGVDGALHRAGGPAIVRELEALGPRRRCPAGSAVITTAGALPAQWVVHAVGPVWRGGSAGEARTLAAAYQVALRLAAENGARSIAMPALSTGVYGYPMDEAAAVPVSAVAKALADHPSIEEATFVLFDARALAAFENALASLEP